MKATDDESCNNHRREDEPENDNRRIEALHNHAGFYVRLITLLFM